LNQLRSCRRSSLSGREPAYARLMENPNPLVRVQAANSWGVWEDAVVSLEPNAKPNVYSDRPPAAPGRTRNSSPSETPGPGQRYEARADAQRARQTLSAMSWHRPFVISVQRNLRQRRAGTSGELQRIFQDGLVACLPAAKIRA